jgi:prepilin-type processing-associated H-X9-DG protein
LSRAKAKARQIKCASTMKQAVLGVIMYADDHDDTISGNLDLYFGGDWRLWLCSRERFPVFIRPVRGPYREAGTRFLPTALFSYPEPVKASRIRKPSEAMLFGDCYEAWGGNSIDSPLSSKPDVEDPWEYSRHNGAAPKVHNGGSNCGLLDGHVEWVRYEELWQLDDDGEVTHPFWYPE